MQYEKYCILSSSANYMETMSKYITISQISGIIVPKIFCKTLSHMNSCSNNLDKKGFQIQEKSDKETSKAEL